MLSTIFEMPGLSIVAELGDNSIELRPEGILKSLGKPIVNQINEYIMAERPAISTEDRYVVSGWLPYIPSQAFNRLVSNQPSL